LSLSSISSLGVMCGPWCWCALGETWMVGFSNHDTHQFLTVSYPCCSNQRRLPITWYATHPLILLLRRWLTLDALDHCSQHTTLKEKGGVVHRWPYHSHSLTAAPSRKLQFPPPPEQQQHNNTLPNIY
jgi:hypothetical protein